MTISVRLSDADAELIKAYAKLNHIPLSALIRKLILEKIENEFDLDCYKKTVKAYNKNPKTYSLDEVKKELDL